jgi:hypothetical protein
MRPFFHQYHGCLTRQGGVDLHNLSATFSTIKASVHVLCDATASKGCVQHHRQASCMSTSSSCWLCKRTASTLCHHCTAVSTAAHDAGPSWHVILFSKELDTIWRCEGRLQHAAVRHPRPVWRLSLPDSLHTLQSASVDRLVSRQRGVTANTCLLPDQAAAWFWQARQGLGNNEDCHPPLCTTLLPTPEGEAGLQVMAAGAVHSSTGSACQWLGGL